ncbi:MAG TPA: hypothetical protein VEK57_21205 [Thermoanaerobaculia bacterium]|nr:hypothetical protein [Thermoanaerobaculia bacterium]
MRGVFERVFRAAAVVALLLVLMVPAAFAEDELPSGPLDARINPPIGVRSAEELSYFDLLLMWAEAGMLPLVW